MFYDHGVVHIWVNARDFCTYRIGEQRMLTCADSPEPCCSHTQSIAVDEGSDQDLDL